MINHRHIRANYSRPSAAFYNNAGHAGTGTIHDIFKRYLTIIDLLGTLFWHLHLLASLSETQAMWSHLHKFRHILQEHTVCGEWLELQLERDTEGMPLGRRTDRNGTDRNGQRKKERRRLCGLSKRIPESRSLWRKRGHPKMNMR